MATSGTVATTTIDTSAFLEHALRRCKVLPSAQTPEIILIARECLYMLLLNLSNRGLNLWCVEKAYMGLKTGQATYTTEVGTLDILNVIYSQPTLTTTTFAGTIDGGTSDAGASVSGVRLGAMLSAPFTGVLSVSTSSDNVTYVEDHSVPSASYATGIYHWFDLNTVVSKRYYKVSSTALVPPVLSGLIVSVAQYDLPMSQWNRDTYASLNAKTQQSRPSTSYFFEKKLTPTLTMWPVPNNDTDHLMVYRHRQPQDVGTLLNTLEIPQRWMDGFIWLLAARLCFELPNVDPATAQIVVQMADKQVFEAEQSESDGAPMYLTPGIGVYSR